MAEEKNTNRAKPKVPLKVSAPHVSGGAAGAASDNEDNKNSARKGALFLVAVVTCSTSCSRGRWASFWTRSAPWTAHGS